jgi:hypothetical protein
METLTDSEYEFHKLKENVENLMVCINKNDEALKKKYCGYPKDSALQYTHTDYYSKVAWKVKFAIISDSNIETEWETIKNMYCLLLNGKREYCFNFTNFKSKTIGCISDNIHILFKNLTFKEKKQQELIKNHGDDTIFWMIHCEKQEEVSNLPDHLICVISHMEKILKQEYNITLIENSVLFN